MEESRAKELVDKVLNIKPHKFRVSKENDSWTIKIDSTVSQRCIIDISWYTHYQTKERLISINFNSQNGIQIEESFKTTDANYDRLYIYGTEVIKKAEAAAYEEFLSL